MYGDKEIGSGKSCPAIIDTGSSTLGVPSKVHAKLKDEWRENLAPAKLDCISNDDFCQMKASCAELEKKIKPLGFQLSGKIFEVPPSAYLHQTGEVCQFGIYKNEIGGDGNEASSMYIIGEPLLKNLYIVYDFEKQEIKMGVSKAASDKIYIYEPGARDEGIKLMQQMNGEAEAAVSVEDAAAEAYKSLATDAD